MVTIIYGAEPWLSDHYREKEIGGMDYVRATSFSSKEALYLKTQLLFDEPRVCLVLDSVKDISDKLIEYVKDPVKDSSLIIQLREYDARSKAFKSLISCDSIELIECKRYSEKQYHAFLKGRIESAGKRISTEAFTVLARRIGYDKDDEVTLYTVENLLDNLINASDEEITSELVEDIVPLKNAVDRFGIAPLISKGEKEKIISLIPAIRKQVGTVAFLNILLRELRVAYKSKLFTRDEIGATSYNFKEWDVGRVRNAVVKVNGVIQDITQSKIPEEAALYMALEGIM